MFLLRLFCGGLGERETERLTLLPRSLPLPGAAGRREGERHADMLLSAGLRGGGETDAEE